MAQKKPSLETLLNNSKGKSLLFLGKEEIFTKDEIQHFANSNDTLTLLYLASNRKIDQQIFEILLNKEFEIVHELLRVQDINIDRLKEIEKKNFDEELFAVLGANRYLTNEVLSILLQSQNRTLISYLSANEQLSIEELEAIYERGIEESYIFLASNPSLPTKLLKQLYEQYKDRKEILISLSLNSSTPQTILRELFEKNSLELNRSLATNASLPMELLNILKVDTRLQNELAENPVFVK